MKLQQLTLLVNTILLLVLTEYSFYCIFQEVSNLSLQNYKTFPKKKTAKTSVLDRCTMIQK